MKKINLLLLVFIISSSLKAQIPLSISMDKTTSLVFPHPVKHVDRGRKEVLVQRVKEAENILFLKAATTDFRQTSLSVVTGDGSIYSFWVCYGEVAEPVHYLESRTKKSVAHYAQSIMYNPKQLRGIRDQSWDMHASVSGIYIKENVLYYQLELENKSPIDYDFDFLRLYIRDKKRSKRTASQEVELIPLHIAGNTSKIKSNNKTVIVLAFEKFTIPDARYLAIEVGEKSGGRHLLMKLNNNKIIRATALPD
jgi:conjugative transposon TraN protein